MSKDFRAWRLYSRIQKLILPVRYPIEGSIWSFVGILCKLRRAVSSRRGQLSLESQDWGAVAVIGRGNSAIEICFDNTDYNLVILCNFTKGDLSDSMLLRRLQQFKSVLVLENRSEHTLSCRQINSLNVSGVMWAGFSDERIPRRRRVSGRLNRMGLVVKDLPNAMSAEAYLLAKGTGNLGLALAATFSQNVTSYGLDFYRSDHLRLQKTDKLGSGFRQREDFGNKIELATQAILNFYPNTSFKMITQGNPSLRGSNVDIVRVVARS